MEKILKIAFSLIMIFSVMACSEDSSSGSMINASMKVELFDTTDNVWKKYGGFCDIADWHPAVESCEISEENGETFRLLTLADGATIKEKHLGAGDVETSYKYSIVEGPLPVNNYVSTFEVQPEHDWINVKWSSEFNASGVSDDQAQEIITGIYEAGLYSILEQN
ncbi:MAG: SRPBCC family protein [Pseudomonadota bacterium]